MNEMRWDRQQEFLAQQGSLKTCQCKCCASDTVTKRGRQPTCEPADAGIVLATACDECKYACAATFPMCYTPCTGQGGFCEPGCRYGMESSGNSNGHNTGNIFGVAVLVVGLALSTVGLV